MEIGDLNPVQDFEAMLAKRSSSEWVQKAIGEMQKYTTALLQNSCEGDNYRKALECVVALRKACIIEQVILIIEQLNSFFGSTW